MTDSKSFLSECQLLASMFLSMCKGAVYYNPQCIPAVLKIIPDSGYLEKLENRTIFDLLMEVYHEDIEPDLIILRNRLQERNMLNGIGGIDYLVYVMDSVATGANYALHARHVRNCYLERCLAGMSDSIRQVIAEPGTAAEKINAISGDLQELQSEIKTSTADDENGLERLIDDTIAGRRQVLKSCWPQMDELSRSFMPGTLTLLCGNPGASKSFMLLQLLSHFVESSISSAVLELEESRAFHTLRVLAQRANIADLTDPDWICAHPDAARRAYSENEDFIRKVSQAITATDSPQTFSQIADWLRQKARLGARFIGVDPITAAQSVKRDIWAEQNDFLQQAKQIAVEYGCSILFITHPVKRVLLPDINQLAGSAAFGRFCQSALWLEHIEETTGDVKTQMGTIPADYNRILHILKARNSIGQGARLACQFDREDLSLKEIGMVVKTKQHGQ
jgi:hypothetical protein